MDLIQILKDRVIPIVLNRESLSQEPNSLNEKSTVISNFIPILLSLIINKPNLISSLQTNLNPRVTDLFQNELSAVAYLIDEIHPPLSSVSKEKTETLLNHSIAPTLGVLEDLAGSKDEHTIAHFLGQYANSIHAALPLWAESILAVGPTSSALASNTTTDSIATIISSYAMPPIQQKPTPEPEKEKSKLWFSWIALIVLALLVAFFLRYCNNKEKVHSASDQFVMTNINAQPAFFQLTTDAAGNLVNCQAYMGHPSFTDIVQVEVKELFDHPIGCDIDSSQQYQPELIDQNALSSILNLVKGLPNTTLTWTGNEISLRGTDAQALQNLAAQITLSVSNLNVNVQKTFDMDQAVDKSISEAEKALANINPDQVKPLVIADALNIQIINFATASSEIPEANKLVLDQAIILINRVSNVNFTVKGFTDTFGTAKSNKVLSQQRAQSVVDYLIFKGVDQRKLKAEGYGEDHPVADNSTEEGKFKNRRIEFSVTNIETDVEPHVSSQGIEKVN